jgi:ribosomal protein L34
VGARLRDAARGLDNPQALADSYLISESAIQENYYITPRMIGEYGEEYEGLFTFTTLSTSRLCPNYVAQQSHAARKVVKLRVLGTEKRVGCSHKLVTLTKPKMIGAGIEKDFAVFDDALVRFRKAIWWTSRTFATVKGEEVTEGDKKQLEKEGRRWSFERDGYHLHAHLLTYSKFLQWEELGELWKKCLKKAAKKHGVKLEFNTSHGRPVVDIRKVKARARDGKDISEEAAIFEVCKYVVKGSGFARLPASQLIELDRALRGRHMLEYWGEYNKRRGSKSRKAATYLDEKKQLTDSEQAGSEKVELPKPEKRRARPLREIGAEMCAAGHEKEWAEMVQEVGRQRREWRKSDLITRFPFNIFYRIDGKEVLYGISTNPASAFDNDELRAARLDYKLDLGERSEEIEAASADERAAWAAVVRDADRTEMRRAAEWQEREAWHAYVNDGPETPHGDVMRWYAYMHEGEPAKSKEEAIAFRQSWFVQGLGVVDQIETNELRAARAFAWELSGKYVR